MRTNGIIFENMKEKEYKYFLNHNSSIQMR